MTRDVSTVSCVKRRGVEVLEKIRGSGSGDKGRRGSTMGRYTAGDVTRGRGWTRGWRWPRALDCEGICSPGFQGTRTWGVHRGKDTQGRQTPT